MLSGARRAEGRGAGLRGRGRRRGRRARAKCPFRSSEGGETPDIRLDAKLGGANLKRRGEDQAVVQDVTLEVSALAAGVTLDGGGEVAAIDLRIPEARVRDMSVYNQFLPNEAPVKLLGGEAALSADVRLEPKSAGGFVKLQTSGLRSRLDGQEIAGELTLDIKLKDGVPKDMRFDISGSSLKLDRIKVTGRTKSFDRSDWNARFEKLQGILKVKGGKKNFEILGAREKFDGYVPGETTLKLTGASPVEQEDSARDAGQRASESRAGARFRNWGRDEHPGKTSYEKFMSQ